MNQHVTFQFALHGRLSSWAKTVAECVFCPNESMTRKRRRYQLTTDCKFMIRPAWRHFSLCGKIKWRHLSVPPWVKRRDIVSAHSYQVQPSILSDDPHHKSAGRKHHLPVAHDAAASKNVAWWLFVTWSSNAQPRATARINMLNMWQFHKRQHISKCTWKK